MNKIKDIDKDQLRLTVEEAFKKAGKDKMPSNEIRAILGSSYTKQQFGGFIVRLTSDKVLARDDTEPLKVGKQRFNYYKLVSKALMPEPTKIPKKEDAWVIYNGATPVSEIIIGEVELRKKVNSLLEGNTFELSIFKLVSKAKNAPNFVDI